MKIYVAHSREYDFKNELYLPIRSDEKLSQHKIILPHESNNNSSNNRDFYKNIDLMIAECSYQSIGLGIELGWAFDDNIPVCCIHKSGMKISGSIKAITQSLYEYSNIDEMLALIENILKEQAAVKDRKVNQKVK